MLPVSQALEDAIRQHERLLISRLSYQEKLSQKSFVSGSFIRTLDAEIRGLRDALAVVEMEIVAIEKAIESLKAGQDVA